MRSSQRRPFKRANGILKRIHIEGYQPELFVDNGKHIPEWSTKRRTDLMVEGKRLRAMAISLFQMSRVVSDSLTDPEEEGAQEALARPEGGDNGQNNPSEIAGSEEFLEFGDCLEVDDNCCLQDSE
jgi:hypothetical protein